MVFLLCSLISHLLNYLCRNKESHRNESLINLRLMQVFFCENAAGVCPSPHVIDTSQWLICTPRRRRTHTPKIDRATKFPVLPVACSIVVCFPTLGSRPGVDHWTAAKTASTLRGKTYTHCHDTSKTPKQDGATAFVSWIQAKRSGFADSANSSSLIRNVSPVIFWTSSCFLIFFSCEARF